MIRFFERRKKNLGGTQAKQKQIEYLRRMRVVIWYTCTVFPKYNIFSNSPSER